jgi:hypothetical protein
MAEQLLLMNAPTGIGPTIPFTNMPSGRTYTIDSAGQILASPIDAGFLYGLGFTNAAGGGSGSGTVNSGSATQIPYYATTGDVVSPAPAIAVLESGGAVAVELGTPSSVAGAIGFAALGGGTAVISAAAGTASTINLKLPSNLGSSSDVLTTDGAGNTSWAAGGGGGGNAIEPETGSSIKVSAFPNAAANMGSADRVTGLQGGANANFSQAQLLSGANAAVSSGLGGATVQANAGAGDGVGAGGFFVIYGGAGGATGNGGGTYFGGGPGGATSGNGGGTSIAGGASPNGNGGYVQIEGGSAPNGTGGVLKLYGGGSNSTGGAVIIKQ